jgi:hypothetical protein
MKSFHQFQEDSTSDTQAAIGSPGGGSSATDINYDKSFKKRPKTGIGAALKDRLLKKREKPEGAGKPGTDGPGPQPDRTPSPYRQKTQKDQGGALAKRPEEKGSMVQRKTAAAKQPPQHKQLAARPASTAMAGSRQKKAIRPAPERKALPAGQGKPIQSGPQRQKIAAQPARKTLPPGGYRATDLRARG